MWQTNDIAFLDKSFFLAQFCMCCLLATFWFATEPLTRGRVWGGHHQNQTTDHIWAKVSVQGSVELELAHSACA